MPVSARLGAGLRGRFCQGCWLASHRIQAVGKALGKQAALRSSLSEWLALGLLYGTLLSFFFMIIIFQLYSE